MRLLLDSHILIWLMREDSHLAPEAHALINGATEVFVSTASIWELAIKARLGKLQMDIERMADLLETSGINELSITRQHVLAAACLPLLHRDPFDRLLIAQAIGGTMRLVTADSQLAAYSDLVTVI